MKQQKWEYFILAASTRWKERVGSRKADERNGIPRIFIPRIFLWRSCLNAWRSWEIGWRFFENFISKSVRVIYSSSCYSVRSPEFLFHIYIIYLLRVKLSDLLRFLEIFEIFVGNTGEFLFVIKFILIYFHSRDTFTTVSKSGTQNLKRNF